MITTKCNRFKGEIENYLRNGRHNFDSTINQTFRALRIKTWLCRTNIVKKSGYSSSHVLFVLFILPILKLKTVHSFCNKRWYQWSCGCKDTFYRFQQRTYRWRSFFYKVTLEIFNQLGLDKNRLRESYFIIDDGE